MHPRYAPRCKPDDPFVPFYRLGGRPWIKDGAVHRIYFDNSPGLRGQSAWEADNPGRFLPPGYYDVAAGQWVTTYPGWTQKDYAALMAGAVRRKTFAQLLPPRELYTSDGVLMQEGMIVMFTGGQIPRRPHWGTDRLKNKLMIAGKRFAYMDKPGRVVPTGPMNIPLREYANHNYPKSWTVYPMRKDEFFEIEGRGVVAQWSFLVVDPSVSLVSVDGGRRFADEVPTDPTPAEIGRMTA